LEPIDCRIFEQKYNKPDGQVIKSVGVFRCRVGYCYYCAIRSEQEIGNAANAADAASLAQTKEESAVAFLSSNGEW